ncbi:XrtB/PEP-CTERM-associated polysaccharide biosynthesis outer membrane protein EpsL [Nitrosovibrio sp. Nv6]|uniref:XrtB/PEP-CTERM-associated polysaccharide biosynthesis outer membrane protein EpsL n=1 Tax=Nitrosovibrio sp. Nv6 TaxID=1855340 RepID=UPI0008CB2F7C|nr:XrtB/PEP-CTERM-associated polysaccharide biosynthesis outer membrane protein EpsL [Nitrosovibrio sp. Nv6]SEP35446.1 exopolysaccharide biosynthesis operon protein EpsL [Nitrosovibrio sp. Nv6]
MKKILLPNLSLPYRRCLAIIIPSCFLLAASHSAAQQAKVAPGDTFGATVGSTFMYDTNVFRISPLIDPAALTGKPTRSDQIITSTATLSLNKVYSMQRFEVNGSLVDNRYNNFDFLNFLGKNYTAAWHWYLTPYLHGRLTSSHSEALNNFANLTGFANSTTRNLRTTDNFHFEGIFEIDRAWHIIGGIDHNVYKNSRVTVQDFNSKVFSVEGGIRYSFLSSSSLTYKVRSGQGEFINRAAPIVEALFDTRFDEMEHEVRLIWPVTGKTSINARAAYLKREHVHFPQRDFGGFVGNFNLNWAITGKTQINAGWTRQLSNYQTASFAFRHPIFERFSSSFIATDRFTVAPIWQISDKIALRLRYDFVLSDFQGAVIPLPAGERSDSMHSALVALDWQPLKAVFISGSLHRDHRNSNLRGFDFDSSAASISAKLNF